MNRKFWLLRGLRFALFAALFIAALGFGTMYLWNWLMPELFHLPTITLGQTYGLLLLGRLLFGFKPGGGGKPSWAQHYKMKKRMAQRMGNLSAEEKEKFRQQMRDRCAAAWGPRRPAEPAPSEATA